MVVILDTSTTQLDILKVFDTEEMVFDLRVYLVYTRRRDNGKVNRRLGTLEQVKSILRPYRNSVKDKEQFDKFLNLTRFKL